MLCYSHTIGAPITPPGEETKQREEKFCPNPLTGEETNMIEKNSILKKVRKKLPPIPPPHLAGRQLYMVNHHK